MSSRFGGDSSKASKNINTRDGDVVSFSPDPCCYEFWIEEESAGEMKKDEEVKKAVYVY